MVNRILTGAIGLTLLAAGPAGAQGFSSGSNGSDGALTFQPNQGVVVFDPQALNLDSDGDGVYHFTSITIPTGTTVRLGANKLGEGKPVVWLASGAVQIDGVIDLSGADGHAALAARTPAEAGAGGYNGGPAGTPAEPAGRSGSGPGGGGGTGSTGIPRCGGGGGHSVIGLGGGNCGAPGQAYGNRFLLPITGGSGGGGAQYSTTSGGSGGGGGGGALLIASSLSIALAGSINAKGGDAPQVGTGNSGGGGSGGAVRLMAPTISGTGSVDVRGGTGPAAAGATGGATGRLRIEAFTRSGLTNNQPATAPIYSRPGLVFPPANAPTVRVTKIGTVDVTTATGSFVTPDATINASGPVALTITATNVPVGTTVRITISPENGAAFTVVSQPLTGTLASSTATTTPVTIPAGFSRFHVLATFTPQ